jgi:hypothetical protein
MALGVSNKVVCIQVLDGGFVHVAGRYFAGIDQVAKPLRGVGVDFVVEVHRPHSPAAGTRVTLCPRMSTGFTTSIASGPMTMSRASTTATSGHRRPAGGAGRAICLFTAALVNLALVAFVTLATCACP